MGKNKYIIIKSWDRFDLIEEVNEKIEEGYAPYGDVIYKTNKEAGVNHDIYIQAMMKISNEEPV